MADWRAILAEIKRQTGWTLDRLARETGVTQGYLSQLQTGARQNPSGKIIERLATGLGVPMAALLGEIPLEIGKKPLEGTDSRELKLKVPGRDGKLVAQERKESSKAVLRETDLPLRPIPIIGRVPASTPLRMNEGPPEDYVLIPGVKDRNAFALQVEGTSMQPKMSDGDLIVVSPNTETRPGDIAVIRVNDDVTVKEFRLHKGRVVLLALNADEHTLMIFDDRNEVEIVGKVVGKYTNMSHDSSIG